VELASSDDEHIINFQIADGEPVEGGQAIELAIALGASSKAFPSMIFDIINLFEDGRWAILRLNGCASQESEFVEYLLSGKRYEFWISGFFNVKSNIVVYQRRY
jgi:predicted ester cyclase